MQQLQGSQRWLFYVIITFILNHFGVSSWRWFYVCPARLRIICTGTMKPENTYRSRPIDCSRASWPQPHNRCGNELMQTHTMIIEFKCTTMYMFWPNLMDNCSSSRTVTHRTLVLVFVLQMIDRICVKVQDHLNSLRNSETDAILEDVRSAEKLIKDARNSKTVRIKRFHLWAHLESCFSSSFLNLIFD